MNKKQKVFSFHWPVQMSIKYFKTNKSGSKKYIQKIAVAPLDILNLDLFLADDRIYRESLTSNLCSLWVKNVGLFGKRQFYTMEITPLKIYAAIFLLLQEILSHIFLVSLWTRKSSSSSRSLQKKNTIENLSRQKNFPMITKKMRGFSIRVQIEKKTICLYLLGNYMMFRVQKLFGKRSSTQKSLVVKAKICRFIST